MNDDDIHAAWRTTIARRLAGLEGVTLANQFFLPYAFRRELPTREAIETVAGQAAAMGADAAARFRLAVEWLVASAESGSGPPPLN